MRNSSRLGYIPALIILNCSCLNLEESSDRLWDQKMVTIDQTNFNETTLNQNRLLKPKAFSFQNQIHYLKSLDASYLRKRVQIQDTVNLLTVTSKDEQSSPPHTLPEQTEDNHGGDEQSSENDPIRHCGNTICEGHESCTSCSQDCGPCTLVTHGIKVNEIHISSLLEGPYWIELVNLTEFDIDMRGWLLSDEYNHQILFPAQTIVRAKQYLVLYRGQDYMDHLSQFGTLILSNHEGVIMDYTSWITQDQAYSWSRIPDTYGPFEATLEVTPNHNNLCHPL